MNINELFKLIPLGYELSIQPELNGYKLTMYSDGRYSTVLINMDVLESAYIETQKLMIGEVINRLKNSLVSTGLNLRPLKKKK